MKKTKIRGAAILISVLSLALGFASCQSAELDSTQGFFGSESWMPNIGAIGSDDVVLENNKNDADKNSANKNDNKNDDGNKDTSSTDSENKNESMGKDAETDERFDEALIVKLSIPKEWTTAKLTTAGQTTSLEIHTNSDGTKFVYANIVPTDNAISTVLP